MQCEPSSAELLHYIKRGEFNPCAADSMKKLPDRLIACKADVQSPGNRAFTGAEAQEERLPQASPPH
jgi:hypothetical protein